MKPLLSCPACRSLRTEVAPDQPKTTFFSFRVVLERHCIDCGHQWEPHAPWWLLILGVMVGFVMLGLGIFLLINGNKIPLVPLIVCAAGGIALHGCILRLLRKRNQS